MSMDHIAVTAAIERKFYEDNQIYRYDYENDKICLTNTKKLGTKKDYYDKYVEKKILANVVENNFGVFHNVFLNEKNPDTLFSIIEKYRDYIESFVNCMLLRKKQLVKYVNEKVLEINITHSDIIAIHEEESVNIFKQNELNIVPIINITNVSFINNSLGFFEYKDFLFIPLSPKKGLYISNKKDAYGYTLNDESKVKEFNQYSLLFDKSEGHGFVFSGKKEMLEELRDFYREYIKK